MKIWLHKFTNNLWYNEHYPLLTVFLIVPSLLYGIVTAIRNKLYDWRLFTAHKLPCPVISIGNITAGGTGKTPLVISIAGTLKNNGYKPAILSRGYKGKSTVEPNVVSDGVNILSSHDLAGDEAMLMAERLPSVPVLTGTNRFALGQYAITHFNSNILLIDDGFQHRKLYRDIDICLISASRILGNAYTFPLGPLREFMYGITRASLFVLTGVAANNDSDMVLRHCADKYPAIAERIKSRAILGAHYRTANIKRGHETYPLDFLHGKRVCCVTGIGNPEGFKKTLIEYGADVVSFLPFPDHHRYDKADITRITRNAKLAGSELIITTEKDIIKFCDFTDFYQEVFCLTVTLDVFPSNEELFHYLRAI